MSKIIKGIQKVTGKVFGHRYTGFTIQVPFINLSFAPVLFRGPLRGRFYWLLGGDYRERHQSSDVSKQIDFSSALHYQGVRPLPVVD